MPEDNAEAALEESAIARQTLALGAAMQGVQCVQQIATEGEVNSERVRPLVSCLLKPYDGSLSSLYGGLGGLAPGLRRLVEQLDAPRDLEATRYLATLLQLERRVVRRRAVLEQITEGLERVRQQADYFGSPLHSSVIGGLAELYSNTVSAVGPRILIQGQRTFLEDEGHASMLRAILFGCVRSATLWRQNGGGRLRLIFGRQRIVRTARDLLRQLPEDGPSGGAADSPTQE